MGGHRLCWLLERGRGHDTPAQGVPSWNSPEVSRLGLSRMGRRWWCASRSAVLLSPASCAPRAAVPEHRQSLSRHRRARSRGRRRARNQRPPARAGEARGDLCEPRALPPPGSLQQLWGHRWSPVSQTLRFTCKAEPTRAPRARRRGQPLAFTPFLQPLPLSGHSRATSSRHLSPQHRIPGDGR